MDQSECFCIIRVTRIHCYHELSNEDVIQRVTTGVAVICLGSGEVIALIRMRGALSGLERQ